MTFGQEVPIPREEIRLTPTAIEEHARPQSGCVLEIKNNEGDPSASVLEKLAEARNVSTSLLPCGCDTRELSHLPKRLSCDDIARSPFRKRVSIQSEVRRILVWMNALRSWPWR
jgi:hypothetical protein